MKQYIMTLCLALCALGYSITSFADNTLALAKASIKSGSTATLHLQMNNDEVITALQFDITMPTGITVKTATVNTDRTTTSKHQVTTKAQSDGSLRVVCLAKTLNATFSGNSGIILDIEVEAENGLTEGSKSVTIKNIEFTTSSFNRITPSDATTAITVTNATVVKTGTWGSNITWTVYDDNSLVLEGSGSMSSFSIDWNNYSETEGVDFSSTNIPWIEYQKTIEKITVMEGITYIGDYAFFGCKSLKEVSLPSTLQLIGVQTFQWCTSLESINLPSNLTDLYYQCFYGCTGLKSITIPKSITYINRNFIEGCTNLSSIDVEYGNTAFSSYNGVLYNSNKTTLIRWPEGLGNVKIPSTVTNMDSGDSFSNCSLITSVVKNSTTIVYMPRTWDQAYTIPNGIKNIADRAFYGCTNMPSITIPNSVTSIGYCSFRDCCALTSVTLPNTVTLVGDWAFYGCSNVEEPIYNNTIFAYLPNSYESEYIIPDGITTISGAAFRNCHNLTGIILPKSLTTIGNKAFQYDANLKSVNLSNKITSIGSYAFEGTGIETLTIPGSIETIPGCAFAACKNLKTVNILDGVKTIGDGVFSGCSNLESVTIPASVTSMDSQIFDYCPNLENVTNLSTLPQSIYKNTFSYYGTLHVKEGCKDAYQSANNWSNFYILEDAKLSSDISNYADVIYIPDTVVTVGRTIELPINLRSTEDMCGAQCNITLPAGITAAMDGTKIMCTAGSRTSDQTVRAEKLANGSILIVSTSSKNTVYGGSDDADIALLTLNIDSEIEPGIYPVTVSNCIMTNAAGTRYDSPDCIAQIDIRAYTATDANNDGKTTITDVIYAIDAMFGCIDDGFVFDAADMDDDGDITVADVAQIVNVIMYGNPTGPQASSAKSSRSAVAQEVAPVMSVNNVTLAPGSEADINVCLTNNSMQVANMQMDIALPDGITIERCTMTSRKSNQMVRFSTLANGLTRIACISTTNSAISDETGDILTIHLKADDNAMSGMFTADFTNIMLSSPSAQKANISNMTSIVTVAGTTSISNITQQGADSKYYSVDGASANNGRGLRIEKMNDGSVRKVIKK